MAAHIELAKAEFSEIGGQIKMLAILAGIVAVAGLSAGLLIAVGLPLFLGEWIFGSMGWGLLLGFLFLLAVAVAAAIAAANSGLGMRDADELAFEDGAWSGGDPMDRPATPLADVEEPRKPVGGRVIVGSLVLAIVIGAIVGVVLGLNLTNRGWTLLGETLLPGVEAGVRPLLVAVASLGVMGLLLGGVGAAVAKGSVVAGAIGGLVLGVLLGGLTAIAVGPRVGAAIGVAVGLIAWAGLMAVSAARAGFSGSAFTKTLKPERTIQTTKETIEWARERMPLSRKS